MLSCNSPRLRQAKKRPRYFKVKPACSKTIFASFFNQQAQAASSLYLSRWRTCAAALVPPRTALARDDRDSSIRRV